MEPPKFHGVGFTKIGKYVRSVFRQLDGSLILADACNCFIRNSGGGGMLIEYAIDCPVDEHRIRATQARGDF